MWWLNILVIILGPLVILAARTGRKRGEMTTFWFWFIVLGEIGVLCTAAGKILEGFA